MSEDVFSNTEQQQQQQVLSLFAAVPLVREPLSHRQLWRETLCPPPRPRPPPLHRDPPRGGRCRGSACVPQPSSAQLHTGEHNTHTHTNTEGGGRSHQHMDTDTGIEGFVVFGCTMFQASQGFFFGFLMHARQTGSQLGTCTDRQEVQIWHPKPIFFTTHSLLCCSLPRLLSSVSVSPSSLPALLTLTLSSRC